MNAKSTWGDAKAKQKADKAPPRPIYDADYYRAKFVESTTGSRPVRMALVGKENTTKTGLALSLARTKQEIKEGKAVYIFDFDSSADNTVDYVCRDAKGKADPNVHVLRIFDETDVSIFNDDNSTNWVALVDKVSWFVNLVGEEAKGGDVASIIFDGGSTFMKWCEYAMSWILKHRENTPIDMDSDRFNQAEWRVRNKLFTNTINRVNSLPVRKVFFTFHLKDEKSYVDLGNGTKGLMKIGEKVDWVNGTQRLFSQQLWLTRYMKNEDVAVGVKADASLKVGDWLVKAKIEEMKGRHTEHLGETHTVLEVKGGKTKWTGLPFLEWD